MTPFWLTAPSVGLVCTTTAKNHSHSTYCPVQQVGVRSRSWVHLDHLQTCTSPCEPCPSYWRYDPASSWFLSSSCREVRRPSPCRSETAASAASCDVTSPDWSDCCSEDLLYCESCPTTYHTQPQRTCYTVRTVQRPTTHSHRPHHHRGLVILWELSNDLPHTATENLLYCENVPFQPIILINTYNQWPRYWLNSAS